MSSLNTPIVSAAALAADPELLARVQFVDARHGPKADANYALGHIRGAVRAHLERDLSAAQIDPKHGGRHPLPAFDRWCARLGRWGIGPDTPVVVYDARSGAHAAARAWWMIRAVGHDKVAVLDGGYEAAVQARLPIDATPTSPKQRGPYPAAWWTLPLAEIGDVEGHGGLLIDVRTADRYTGVTEPFDPVPGHIPGAINDPLTCNLGPDGRFLSASALRDRLQGVLGGHTPAQTILSCGSGVTACHTLLALEAAGLPGAALYVGSWSEWCRTGRPNGVDA